MSADELVLQKITELKGKGVEEETLKNYIADALEFAFIKTLAPRIESLSEDSYQKVLASLTDEKLDQVTDVLFGESDTAVNDIDEHIFVTHLKEALEV